jgi:FtsP/CotA-like multicopper oxidase with cupredoxin domain
MKNEKRTMLKQIFKRLWPGILLLVGVLFLNGTPAQASFQDLSAAQPDAIVQAPQLAEVNASAAAAPLAQAVSIDLCASDGSITMPDGVSVPVYGYVDTGGGACTTGLVTSLPGPEIQVSEGTAVTINLTNALSEPTSIYFPGQSVTSTGGVSGMYAQEAAAGGSVSYSFTASAGTHLYESGSNPQIQVGMGLYGALIVDPATPGQAYNDANPAYSYDEEAVLVLSEIDPNLNANPAGFDLLDYSPTYWLINGQAYPDIPSIEAAPGARVRLRYLNAGFLQQVMSSLGAYQTVVGVDSFKVAHPNEVVAQTIPAGQTADLLISASTDGSNIALFNRNLRLTNGLPGAGHTAPDGGGGMMTFIEPTGVGPATLNFNDYTILSHGGTQDTSCGGPVTVEDGGATLHIVGNCWKKIDLNYDVTANTVIEFDFQSSVQGEIHAIGFDTDNVITPATAFQLYGTQTWGLQPYNNYAGGGVQHYVIPAGQFFTGTGMDLIFANDHDVALPTGESVFSNILIYEVPPPPPPMLTVNGNSYLVEQYGGAAQNPGSGTVAIEDGGTTLHMVGNGWYRISLPYNVTASTVLEFDFSSSLEGEIQGIGLDNDNNISPGFTFQLYGSQGWGNQTYSYTGAGGVQHFIIPVGTHYTGSMIYLFFANDDDANLGAESVFSDISVTN